MDFNFVFESVLEFLFLFVQTDLFEFFVLITVVMLSVKLLGGFFDSRYSR